MENKSFVKMEDQNNNAFNSTQDQVGGPQEDRIEEGTSNIWEG